jgi:hypothetical protein
VQGRPVTRRTIDFQPTTERLDAVLKADEPGSVARQGAGRLPAASGGRGRLRGVVVRTPRRAIGLVPPGHWPTARWARRRISRLDPGFGWGAIPRVRRDGSRSKRGRSQATSPPPTRIPNPQRQRALRAGTALHTRIQARSFELIARQRLDDDQSHSHDNSEAQGRGRRPKQQREQPRTQRWPPRLGRMRRHGVLRHAGLTLIQTSGTSMQPPHIPAIGISCHRISG